MILALTGQEWIALLGVICTILSVVVIPVAKFVKKKRDQYLNTIKTVQYMSKGADETLKAINNIKDDINEMKSGMEDINNQFKEMKEKTDKFETQQLKYMINDAFYSFNGIEEIPDEVLINASQCCDIYVGKGLNHETGARCKLIYAELERRQKKLATHKEEGDHHE